MKWITKSKLTVLSASMFAFTVANLGVAGVIKDTKTCQGQQATFTVFWTDANGNSHTDTVTLDCTPKNPALGDTIEDHSGWDPGSSKCGHYDAPPNIPANIFTGESFMCGQQDAKAANSNE